MAISKDWQVMQSTMLFKLLLTKKKSKDGMISAEVLNEVIGELEASMSEEEIKHVESKVAKYFN